MHRGRVLKVAMTASFRGLPACNTEACGRSQTAYRHLWNTTRDGQYYPAFQQLIDAAEVRRVPLPPRSPNLNAYAERWVRSVKEEWTGRRFSKPDQPRQERYSLGRGCVIQAAGWGWGPASRVRRADGSGAGRPTQGLVERRNPSSNSVTFSACSCCTQCPAPSSRGTPVIREQAVPFILSTAPGRW